ncbi:AbrB family transcriptional regulator [Corynebacterium bovis]|uniref:AbrB family transcriptional regulator n=1 Tax=Corynebacterium bovis TaxID=36808 RepID=UPI003C7C54A1
MPGVTRPRRLIEVAGVSLCAGLLAVLCVHLGVPAPWIVSFLLVFGAWAVVGDRRVTPPRSAMTPAQVVISMLCAVPLVDVGLRTVVSFAWPALLSTVVTLTVCGGAAVLLTRWARVGPVTAVLSTLAGGASAMTMMARDLDADARFVTLTQYLRLTLVVLTIPVMVGVLGAPGDGAGAGGAGGGAATGPDAWWAVDWRPVVGVVGVYLLVRLIAAVVPVPSPFLLLSIPLVVVLAAAGVPEAFLLPHGLVTTLAYALVGVQAGGTLTWSSLRQFASALPIIVGAIVTALAGCLAAAWVIARGMGLPLLDAYLATTPGGIYAVLAYAHDAHAGAVVTVVQVVRVVVMLVVGAYMPALLGRWARR